MRRTQNKNFLLIFMATSLMAVLILYLISQNAFGQKKAGANVSIVLIPKVIDVNNDFWEELIEGGRLAAQEKNATLTVLGGPTETDIDYPIMQSVNSNDYYLEHNFEKEELYLSERVFQYIIKKQFYR